METYSVTHGCGDVCFILIPSSCLSTLFTPVYSFLSHPHMYQAPLSSLSSLHPSVSIPVICSFFLIPPYISHFIVSSLLPPHAFICLPLFYPSSLISSVFLSPVMLSSLPSYPFCLISFLFPLILSSVSPSVSLVTFTDCLSETVLPKQCTKCHFHNTTSNSFCSQTTLSV